MEELDLYDMYKNKTKRKLIRGEKVPDGFYFYIVQVCIFNSKGELLIQKRSQNKKKWPNLWDVSAAGCVSSKENSNEAIQRELEEELGIVYDFSKTRPLFTYSFEHGYCDEYVIDLDVDLKSCILQKEEVSEVRYASIEEVKEMIKNGDFINYYESIFDMIYQLKNKKNMMRDVRS